MTWSMNRTFNGRFCTGLRRSAMPKVDSARRTLFEVNPDVKVRTYNLHLDASNILDIFKDYDVIVSGSDNFTTAYMVNDAAVMLKKPVVYGSIFRFDGQASTFIPYQGPCFRCLYATATPPELAPSCDEAGVLGVLPGVVGLIQATEVVKLLLNIGTTLVGPPIDLRRSRHEFPAVQNPARSGLRGLRSKREYRPGIDSGIRVRRANNARTAGETEPNPRRRFRLLPIEVLSRPAPAPEELGLVIEIKRNNFKILYPNDKRCWLPREAFARVRPEHGLRRLPREAALPDQEGPRARMRTRFRIGKAPPVAANRQNRCRDSG